MLLSLLLCSSALLADEGRAVDVAVVAGSQEPAVVDAVRAALVVAARERRLGVIDLQAQGLTRAWQACSDVPCRRLLAARRGAEWQVIVDDGSDVALVLIEGEVPLAAVSLQGPRFAQLGRVPGAVDELLEQVRPRSHVQRQGWLQRARDHRRDQDLRGAADAFAQAFALVVDDRAVETALSWTRTLDELGDDAGCDAAFNNAGAVLLAADAPLTPQARARFVVAFQEHLWRRAHLLSDIADADRGPDHGSLASAAFDAWQELATSTWPNPDVSRRAADMAGRYSIDATLHALAEAPSTP